MRSLLPVPAERVNLVEAYSKSIQAPEGRPFVRLNMVSTVDGAVAFAGRSGPLGGPGDKLVFSVLRAIADVILVGAGTVRAEHYGPPRLPPEVQALRERRGQTPLPRLAVVSQSAYLDWTLRLFSAAPAGPAGPAAIGAQEAPGGPAGPSGPAAPGGSAAPGGPAAVAQPRPLVIVPGAAPAENVQRLATRADVLTAGEREVDLSAALQELGRLGARHILCEGGPRLNSSLVAAGLVDELCLTLSPKLAGPAGGGLPGGGWLPAGGGLPGGGWLPAGWLGSRGQAVARRPGDEAQSPLGTSSQPRQPLSPLEIVHVLEEDSFLFLRMRVQHDLAPGS